MIAYAKLLPIWYPGPLECADPVVRYHLPLVKNDHWKSHGSSSKDSNIAYKNNKSYTMNFVCFKKPKWYVKDINYTASCIRVFLE